MSGWRGVVLAALIGVAMAVGLQPLPVHAPIDWSQVQLPTLGGQR